MKSIFQASLVIFTAIVIACVFIALATSRSDACYEPPLSQWTPHIVSTQGPSPTLAPPRAKVEIQIEADKSDLEISWVED